MEKVKTKEQSKDAQMATAEPDLIVQPIKGGKVEKPEVDAEYQIEVIKDYYGNVDIFYLPKKDPRYEYRFLRADDKNLSLATGNMLLQGGGWQLCGKEHCIRIGIQEKFLNANGQYQLGDLLLSFIPKHLYAEKRAHEHEKANAPLKAIEEKMKKGFGVDGIHDTMKGIQTQKQLNIE